MNAGMGLCHAASHSQRGMAADEDFCKACLLGRGRLCQTKPFSRTMASSTSLVENHGVVVFWFTASLGGRARSLYKLTPGWERDPLKYSLMGEYSDTVLLAMKVTSSGIMLTWKGVSGLPTDLLSRPNSLLNGMAMVLVGPPIVM